jgi:hypothetical protein
MMPCKHYVEFASKTSVQQSRTNRKFAGRVGSQIEADSLELPNTFKDSSFFGKRIQ